MYRVFFLLIFVFVSCSKAEVTADKKATIKPFFDLNAFFDEQIEGHTVQTLVKTATSAEQVDTQTFETFDLSEELKIFKNCDLNKPAWFDAYQIDSTFQKEQLVKISYKALKEDLKTQELNVEFKEAKVQKISIRNLSDTPIYQSNQILTYEPKKGYRVESTQNSMLSAEKIYKLEVKFIL